MEKNRKSSFVRLLTMVTLLMIVLTTVSLSLILFYNLRKTITNFTELNTRTSMAYSRDMVISAIKEHEDAMGYVSTGLVYLFKQETHAGEEQSAGGKQILNALGALQDITGKVKEGTDNIHHQSGAIQKAVVKLENVSQKVAQQAVEVNTASEKITAHLENAKELTYSK